ncbi:unnamed protein product [Chrysoparadoxa australica]
MQDLGNEGGGGLLRNELEREAFPELTIRSVSGGVMQIKLSAELTVAEVKKEIKAKCQGRWTASEQRLIYYGKICTDDQRLKDVLRSLGPDTPHNMHLVSRPSPCSHECASAPSTQAAAAATAPASEPSSAQVPAATEGSPLPEPGPPISVVAEGEAAAAASREAQRNYWQAVQYQQQQQQQWQQYQALLLQMQLQEQQQQQAAVMSQYSPFPLDVGGQVQAQAAAAVAPPADAPAAPEVEQVDERNAPGPVDLAADWRHAQGRHNPTLALKLVLVVMLMGQDGNQRKLATLSSLALLTYLFQTGVLEDFAALVWRDIGLLMRGLRGLEDAAPDESEHSSPGLLAGAISDEGGWAMDVIYFFGALLLGLAPGWKPIKAAEVPTESTARLREVNQPPEEEAPIMAMGMGQ